MSDSVDERKCVLSRSERIYTREQVQAALDKLAQEVSGKLADSDPVVMCVMLGGVVTMGELLTRLNFPLTIDYVHATRYRGETRGGELHWLMRPRVEIKNRTVLLVDDIFDEGITLKEIMRACREWGAKDVYSAVLAEKEDTSQVDFAADFVGLRVPNSYVFGYGMDYKEYWRNADGIYALRED